MPARPVFVLGLLTLALLAGCTDGPPSGDVVAIPGAIDISGSTAENTYVAQSGGADNPDPEAGNRLCPPPQAGEVIPPCVEASSTYSIHIMDTLPEPSGEGYKVFQMGGSIGERSLCDLQRTPEGMWGCEMTKEADESTQFDRLELRMGDFLVATASSASGSQAFVLNPAMGGVTVDGSYDGRSLEIDVQGLPEGQEYVGRLYTRGISGNLTLAESFPVVAGAQEYRSDLADIGDYEEFHVHVGTSLIYVYQGTL